ncbi:hypothetical protein DEU56DRAFT_752461 [Suillus clintonianus]|uniref:uncharacterized protein n=1 Tax=Suillus clintonianus TaxID=1904413 RepID=UPI001B877CA3|nr:uncharacterized protein DEU56DRAFT_752461 [Suillus clintonianus]KAG2150793.1 hypothetical protein DEU56DRAFT_752461 [Suillus clintonianus]
MAAYHACSTGTVNHWNTDSSYLKDYPKNKFARLGNKALKIHGIPNKWQNILEPHEQLVGDAPGCSLDGCNTVAEAALPTPTPLNVPIPGSSFKCPAICFSSGYPSPAPVEVRKTKKVKMLKGKGKATEPAMPSGSGSQGITLELSENFTGNNCWLIFVNPSGQDVKQIFFNCE